MNIPTESFPFDPTYGYDEATLRTLRPPEAPPGFDAFWQARYTRALKVDPQPQLSPSTWSHPEWDAHDLAYTSTNGVRICGWLLRPREGTIRRGLVVGHGYGGRDAPDGDLPVAETAILFPCFRGLSRSELEGVPTDAAAHVLTGIDDPHHFIVGGCVEDIWVAVSALEALHPEVSSRIGYSGISLGGGVGALALALDPRIDRAHLEVPTFGNIPLWLTLPSTGSAHAVQAYCETHPEVAEVLQLFDAAVAATRIRQPTLAAVACFDPSVAPPCQFTVANALASSNGNELFMLDAGHVDYTGMDAQHALLAERVRHLFTAT